MLDSPRVGSTAAEGVFVGIDWGNSHHQLCILDSEGQLVEQGRVTHDVAGISELQSRLRRRAPVAGRRD